MTTDPDLRTTISCPVWGHTVEVQFSNLRRIVRPFLTADLDIAPLREHLQREHEGRSLDLPGDVWMVTIP
jgi:hypothetical protein